MLFIDLQMLQKIENSLYNFQKFGMTWFLCNPIVKLAVYIHLNITYGRCSFQNILMYGLFLENQFGVDHNVNQYLYNLVMFKKSGAPWQLSNRNVLQKKKNPLKIFLLLRHIKHYLPIDFIASGLSSGPSEMNVQFAFMKWTWWMDEFWTF